MQAEPVLLLLRSLGAAVLAAGLLAGAAAAGEGSRWGRGYVPNHPVLAQDGKTFNFYDDLIQDRIAVVSFIYTTCREICPVATARLSQLQDKLGDHMGRDVFFYSITVDPETDTPERMAELCQDLRRRPRLVVPDRPARAHQRDPLPPRRTQPLSRRASQRPALEQRLCRPVAAQFGHGRPRPPDPDHPVAQPRRVRHRRAGEQRRTTSWKPSS